MVPKPQEDPQHGFHSNEMDGESVVITGMSGLYPDSRNVKELSKILYEKKNPVTAVKPRWSYDHPEVPAYTGILPDADRFDAQFFKVHFRQAPAMDCMSRKILEQAYQAIFDAGLNSEHLNGRKVGVYIGSCFSESEKSSFYDTTSSLSGFGISGCSKTMFANRISYWLNVKGPSMAIDSGCCSSITALKHAYDDMRSGECEAAIVGGACLCLHPQSAINYGRVIKLSKDGKTKSFDENCDGCARSEAVNVIFLQKAKDALRIYAQLLHVKSEFVSLTMGEKGPKYGFIRDPSLYEKFVRGFYDEAKVDPRAVEYVEAFGSACSEVDKEELEVIDKVFCKNKANPLLVGSVMSNIGYTEAASGISSITKVALAYEHGVLAANLNCSSPRKDVAALREGRMRIVTDHQPFHSTYVAVNSVSITGLNAHALLHGYYKPKDFDRYKSNIPRLVTFSGRHEAAVKKILDDLKSRPIDPEEHALLHNVHELSQPGHMSRGFTVLDTNNENKTVSLVEQVEYFDDMKRPLWFVYSGMGSQWAGMGEQFMRLPVFAAAIERCHKVLAPKGIDIVHIITSRDKTIYDNILHSFVGIAAVQIGLTDVLREMGIVPDNIIGHSVGELGCGYADDCFTAEEMILAAYSRGLVSVQTPFIHGSMAAVGIGYQEAIKICPPEIQVACHNSADSATISGPAEAMRDFVAKLTAQGIFAKEVPCSNIAFHSRYIAEAGPKLLELLSEVIKTPKRRTERWMSTSIPQEKWNETNSQYCSAWYHTNNLLNPVLFEETSRLVPANAVLVEIAPHGLLQAILKRSLPGDCHNISLAKRGHPDNVQFLLQAIGKLYLEGYNPKVKALYPKVEFPVSTGTPMLSHLVEWSHGEKWSLPLFVAADRKSAPVCNFFISIHDDEHAYLKGNVIRNRIQFPFAAALVAVWDTFAMAVGAKKKQISVQFRDIHLFSQPIILDKKPLQFTVTFQWGTGRFEVMTGPSKIATGFITSDITKEKAPEDDIVQEYELNSEQVYELLKEMKYSYKNEFCSIHKINASFTKAQLLWNNNWVTLLDGMIQMNVLSHAHNTMTQPSHINKIIIDVPTHLNIISKRFGEESLVAASLSPIHSLTRCGGILMKKIKFYDLPLPNIDTFSIKSQQFIPRFQHDCSDILEIFKIYLQIVAENQCKDNIKVIEITKQKQTNITLASIKDIGVYLNDVPGTNIKYETLEGSDLLEQTATLEADVILITDLSEDMKVAQTLQRVLRPKTFIINGEMLDRKKTLPTQMFEILSSNSIGIKVLELGLWNPGPKQPFTNAAFVLTPSDFSNLSTIRHNIQNNEKLLILTSYPPMRGLKSLIINWRKESNKNQVVLASIADNEQLIQTLPWASYDLDLAFNVLKEGIWGGDYFVSRQENVAIEQGMTLQSKTIGDLDSFQWTERSKTNQSDGVTVVVRYAGINDYDVNRATGVIPPKQEDDANAYGMDFSGITSSGQRVMGIVKCGAASGYVIATPKLLWPVPEHWTLEDAATVPLAYAQAFYCLGIKADLQPGMTVLVHGAAGALGQAVLSIAFAYNCRVFATVSTSRKKHFLRRMFPALKDADIGNSRDDSFADNLMQATKGRGCDIIISCVKGGLKNTTLRCAAYCGITIDTAQAHAEDDYTYGMHFMTKQRSYVMVDFNNIFEYQEDMDALQAMMSEGITRGYVRPLSRVTFSAQDASRAFRLIAASQHRGRVLLRLRDIVIGAQARVTCSSKSNHLVFCDSDGLGLQLAGRLISRGAKTLSVFSSKPLSNSQLYKIKKWQNDGIKVTTTIETLSETSIVKVLNKSAQLAPIEGIYIVLSNTNEDQLKKSVAALNYPVNEICPSLKYCALIAGNKNSTEQYDFLKNHYKALSAKVLCLSAWDEELNSWDKILDTIEHALHSTEQILLINSLRKSMSLLQQIVSIGGIELGAIKEDTALKSIGIDNSRALAIAAFLRNYHNISLDEDDVMSLTVKRIKELEESLIEPEYKEATGIGSFFSYIDRDELLATTQMVILPTLVQNTTKRDNEIDVNQTYLAIIPGLEGHYERFRPLCQRLKLPAVVLQPGTDFINETLQDTAKRYTEVLLKKIQVKDDFYLLGYESGVKVALQIASNLEKEGLTGTVYCLGGTPEDIEMIINSQLQAFDTEEALQDALIRHMSQLMIGKVPEKLNIALTNNKTWEDKLNASVNSLLGHVSYSKQYARLMIEGALARIGEMRREKVGRRLQKSRIILLRASSNLGTPSDLNRYSQETVKLYNLDVPLARFISDPRCAAIINRHFSNYILEKFENHNLCHSYLLNADVFMMKTNADDDVDDNKAEM